MNEFEKINEAIELIKKNKLIQAKKLVNNLINKDSKNEVLYNLLGTIFIKEKKFINALEILNQGIKINKNFTSAYVNIGIVYSNLNELDKSIEYFKKALRLDNSLDIINNNIGHVLNKQKKYSKAIIYLNKIIKTNPNYAEAYYNLGQSFFELNKLEDAAINFSKAISINSVYSAAFFYLGEVRKKQFNYDEALKNYLNSNQPKTTNRVLECLMHLGHKKEYFKQIEKLTQKDADNRRIAAISSYLANQFNIPDSYPFCPNPLSYVYKLNILQDLKKEKNFLIDLLKEINEQDFLWDTPSRTTVHGYTSKGNLSKVGIKKLNQLEKIFDLKILEYCKQFVNDKSLFIKKFPKKYSYYSWCNQISKQGYNVSHMHPSGWLSGVFYINVPSKIKGAEAGIEFSLHGDSCEIINTDIPNILITPENGDLVLFPSSLYHKTIPFNSNENRIIIAFDINKKE